MGTATHRTARVIETGVIGAALRYPTPRAFWPKKRAFDPDFAVPIGGHVAGGVFRFDAGHVVDTVREARGIVMSDADTDDDSKSDMGACVTVGTEGPPATTRSGSCGSIPARMGWARRRRCGPGAPCSGCRRCCCRERVPGVVGTDDISADWLPIHDRSALPDFSRTCGMSGNRSGTLPVTRRIIVTPIEPCEADRDHDAPPLWMDLPMSEDGIDLGAFSRLRRANCASRFSVSG